MLKQEITEQETKNIKASAWLDQAFSAQAVEKQRVVRRCKDDVHHYASFELLLYYVTELGFHLIETGDQYIVICNDGQFKIHR